MKSEMEFIVHPQVQAIFDHFRSLHDIRIAFYTPDGRELRVGGSRANCAYCSLLRSLLGYEGTCRALDRRKRREANRAGESLITYECHGGMIEAIMPVHISGRLVGFVMIGQFRTRRSVPRGVTRACPPRLRRRLQATFAKTPLFSEQRVTHVLGLVQVLVQFIAERRMIAIKDVIGPILARLREHPEERLSLTGAAAMVGRNPTTLSHLFRRTLGKSFRQVRAELAVQKADELFESAPGIRVCDVARRLGFDDQFYFSRLYRKQRGFPPTRRRRT